jgi:lysophospholipase L1-like esterase
MNRLCRFAVAVFFVALSLTAAQNAVAQQAAVAEKSAVKAAPIYSDAVPGVGPIRSEDWFVKTWHDRRGRFADQKAEQQNAVVFFGDSITQGWGDDFRGKFKLTPPLIPPRRGEGDGVLEEARRRGEGDRVLKFANRGISGDTTRGLLARVDADVLALNPRGIVLLIGTNDIGLKISPADIAGNVKLLLDKLAAHDPKLPIILCQVMPTSPTKDRPTEKIRELNERLADVARDFNQVTVLDTYTLFANKDGEAPAELFPDLLHLNDAAYDKWRAALWPLFATLGFVETEPDQFRPEAGFTPLFNGHDLDGWGYRPTSDADLAMIKKWRASDKKMPAYPIVETAESFDDKGASADGRFRAMSGRLVVMTPVEGRRIQQLATTRDFAGDFTLKLEFRATPNADSGVFIRGRQLQCRDYPLAGPYKNLKNYKPQDWNELVITVRDNKAHCTCNGEVLEEAYELPETGPIGLEGDRGQLEYRRIRISRKA